MAEILGQVLVCKEHSEAYREALERRGFKPWFLQVLETNGVNQESLRETIRAGPEDDYDGVIITSARAAKCWAEAVRDLDAELIPGAWDDVPFYVVGQATATALRGMPQPPARILGADEAGTGEKLARFIVDRHKEGDSEQRVRNPRFLYLTGDKNRETIPTIFSDARFGYTKLQVYQTVTVSDLEQRLADIHLAMRTDTTNKPDGLPWIVLFSPSTASSILTTAVWSEFTLPSPSDRRAFRIAAIGPTTEGHLNEIGHKVEACSAKPDARSLADAIHATTTREAE